VDNINNAYTEILVILRNLKGGYFSIPRNLLDKMIKECNLNHKFRLQPNLPIREQNLLDETKAILSIFYRDYWSSSEQRELIKQKEKYELQLLEQRKKELYNIDNLFKK
jgi:G:T/U-mismatch repair DNA glycosylase